LGEGVAGFCWGGLGGCGGSDEQCGDRCKNDFWHVDALQVWQSAQSKTQVRKRILEHLRCGAIQRRTIASLGKIGKEKSSGINPLLHKRQNGSVVLRPYGKTKKGTIYRAPTRARPCFANCGDYLVFADVFVPDGGIILDVRGEERNAVCGVEVDDFDVERAEPVDAALEGAGFADDDAGETELTDEAAAIPAGSESGEH
jgi:hypothetical protein